MKYIAKLTKPIRFNSGLPKIIIKFSEYINNIFINNYDNTTNLHRWCHNHSEKYKDTCNWETKLDYANKDNSL
jgi:hypothetical protein